MSGPPRGRRSGAHADRQGLPTWLVASLVVSCCVVAGIAGQMGARNQVSSTTGFLVGVLVAILTVLGLPSLSIRLTARLVVAVSAVVMARFGVLSGSLVGGGQTLVAWLVAVVAVFVLTDRIGTEANRPLDPAHRPERSAMGAARRVVAVGLVVVLLALLLAPWLAPRIGSRAQAGQGPTLDPARASGAMRSSETLDMTTRPDLTDEVVMTVDSNRETFLRGETYDTWDGRTWSRSDRKILSLAPGNEVIHAPDDIGAGGDDVVRQRIRVEVNFANIVYAAATPTAVRVPQGVVQRPDATLLSSPMGRGATYSVTSRRPTLSQAVLRAAGAGMPQAILDQYAQPPETTERVKAAARRAVRGSTNTYDRIAALERWMGARTKYALDAPLAPQGVDVVDHFLFESKEGWCEQIASSLVVLARVNGIPARLVTGYVPGEQDPVTGRFVVRAKNAHAWAEVWFPKYGWVPFDPTANVALAGNDAAHDTWAHWLATHWIYLVLAIAVIAVVAGPIRLLVRRYRSRRAARPHSWAGSAEARLERLGRKVGRPRNPNETAVAYATVLARRFGDERLVRVGQTVDDAIYAPVAPTPADQAAVDAILQALASAEVPSDPDGRSGVDGSVDPDGGGAPEPELAEV